MAKLLKIEDASVTTVGELRAFLKDFDDDVYITPSNQYKEIDITVGGSLDGMTQSIIIAPRG